MPVTMFRVGDGYKCERCSGQIVDLNIGSTKICVSCGHTFTNLCNLCSKLPCIDCGGLLKDMDEVFPHSLFRAIKDGDIVNVARLLRDHPAHLDDLRDGHGYTALATATAIKDGPTALEICENLLKHGASPHTTIGDEAQTPLTIMVSHRRFDRRLARLLGASINDRDRSGRTALMFAAKGAGLFGGRRGNSAIVQELLDLRADPSIKDNHGYTALGYAILSNDTGKNNEMIEFLKNEMEKRAAFREFRRIYRIVFDDHGVESY